MREIREFIQRMEHLQIQLNQYSIPNIGYEESHLIEANHLLDLIDLDPNFPDDIRLDFMKIYSSILIQLNYLEKGEVIIAETYDKTLALYGLDHEKTLDCLDLFGFVLLKSKQYKKAKDLYKLGYERSFHVEFADTQIKLTLRMCYGESLYHLGDYYTSTDILYHCYEDSIRELGEMAGFTLICGNWLASSFLELAEYDRAIELTKDIYLKTIQVFPNGPLNEQSMNLNYLLANIYQENGDYTEALDELNKLYDLQKTASCDHSDINLTLRKIAQIYFTTEDYEKSKEYSIILASNHMESLGANAPEYASDCFSLGTVSFYLDDFEEAIRYLEKSFLIYYENYGYKYSYLPSIIQWMESTWDKLGLQDHYYSWLKSTLNYSDLMIILVKLKRNSLVTDKKLSSYANFIKGFQHYHILSHPEDLDFFSGFNDYVCEAYALEKSSDFMWYHVIPFFEQSEDKSVTTFFELLQDFKGFLIY